MMPDISPSDRDMMIRTIIGEADDQPPIGKAAVAHVILNRMQNGRWGDTPTDVVLSRGQFEPWKTRTREMFAIRPNSPSYKDAAAVVDDVIAGKTADPTGGATHFLDPAIVRRRRGGSLPDWAQGQGVTIGDHAFFRPPEMGPAPDALSAINAAIGPRPASVSGAMAYSDEPGGLFSGAGFTLPGAKTGAPTVAPASGSLFESAGFKLPTATAAAPAAPVNMPDWATKAGAVNTITMPGSGGVQYVSAKGDIIPSPTVNPPSPSIKERLHDWAADIPSRYAEATARDFAGATALKQQGLADFGTNYGWGALKTAAGMTGQLFSPVQGALDVAAEEINRLTGTKGTGERALLMVPGPKVGATVQAARPSVRAFEHLVSDIGEENLPGVVRRLEANPSLSPMDVAPGVQTRAIGIAKGEASPGQTTLFESAAARNADRRNMTRTAFGETIGEPPNTVQLLDKMKADAREVGEKQIQPALEAAGPVDVTHVIKAIDSEIGENTLRALRKGKAPPTGLSPIQQRLLQIRQQLTYRDKSGALPKKDEYFIDATGAPNAGAADTGAHGVQSRLRYEASQLTSSAAGSDRIMGGAIGTVRNALVDAIDQAAGGKYKPALSAYRDEMHVQEAFDKGMTVASGAREGAKGLENRPEAWQKWWGGLGDKEKEAARLGARTVIDNHIGTIRQAGRAGIDIPDAPFTRDKLNLLFGKKETDRLVNLLADERAKAETNTLLTKQSVTARAQAAQKETTPREVRPLMELGQKSAPLWLLDAIQGTQYTGYPGALTALAAGIGGAKNIAQRIGRAHDIATNTEYARLASMIRPETRGALLDALRARAASVGQPRSLSNAAGSLLRLPFPQ